MQRGQIERREFEYKRHGTVSFLVSFNVYDGKMWGCCLDANDHEHFLWGVRQLQRRYARARRIHLIMDNGMGRRILTITPKPTSLLILASGALYACARRLAQSVGVAAARLLG